MKFHGPVANEWLFSPNLKLKPVSKRSGSGVIQLNVECYGGGLWHTWFD